MNPTRTNDRDTAVLAAARGFRRDANAAEAGLLATAVEWAHLRTVEDPDDAATIWSGSKTMGQDTGIPIAGEGSPLISEFAVLELAAALGLSAESGRNLVAQALELAHRLPKVWARVQTGSLAPWRARRIAEATLHLSPEAAAFVDAQVAAFAHKTGVAQTRRLVDEAIARFMPEAAAEQRERAAEQRYFTVDHGQVSFAGTSRVHGELDLADALDLEDAVRRGAEQLKALGNEQSLDVRRSLAVGMLARGQQALEFDTADAGGGGFEVVPEVRGACDEPRRARCARTSTTGGRQVVLYVHLSEDALRTGDPHAPAWIENAGRHLITAGQVAEWCGAAGKLTVKPVIDLGAFVESSGYQPSPTLAEQVRLRDMTCVYPWCNRPADSCDLDHILPWRKGGRTNSWNLACLCRKHHRLKTHGGWTYTMIKPGTYLWRSPRGHLWLRDPSGTTDLGPAEPPERRTS